MQAARESTDFFSNRGTRRPPRATWCWRIGRRVRRRTRWRSIARFTGRSRSRSGRPRGSSLSRRP